MLLPAALLLPATAGWPGIAQTKHNLSGSTDGPMMSLCVFCHTPLGDPVFGKDPDWAPSAGSGSTPFETFDDLGRLDPNRGEVVGSVSTACLSCHDGAQALGVAQFTFDHPYGIPYRGSRAAQIAPGAIPRESDDPDAYAEAVKSLGRTPETFATTGDFTGFREPTSGVIDNTRSWWLETGGDGRQRTDIKLYPRTFGDGTEVPYIECASCHDPHTETRTFLRVDNSGRARLCLGCHEI